MVGLGGYIRTQGAPEARHAIPCRAAQHAVFAQVDRGERIELKREEVGVNLIGGQLPEVEGTGDGGERRRRRLDQGSEGSEDLHAADSSEVRFVAKGGRLVEGGVPASYDAAMALHPEVARIDALLQPHAQLALAAPMQRYMRDRFEFLGIKAPHRRALLREHWRAEGVPPVEDLPAICRGLWSLPYREAQHAGIDLLQRRERALTADFVALAEELICGKAWWDTVDALASHTVGTLFARYPAARDAALPIWRCSDDLWLRRTTLLFQLGYKERTDRALLFELIRDNLGSKEFFINKAIGWALRALSKVDADAVRRFVEQTDLVPLSRREALKWLVGRARDSRAI